MNKNEQNKLHNQIIFQLRSNLKTGERNDIIRQLQGDDRIGAARLEQVEGDTNSLCSLLEDTGLIKRGNYSELVELLRSVNAARVLDIIEPLIADMSSGVPTSADKAVCSSVATSNQSHIMDEHRRLFNILNDEMEERDLASFKNQVKGTSIRRGRLETMTTMREVLDALEGAGKIKPNHYDYLLDIFDKIERPRYKDYVIEALDNMKAYTTKRSNDFDDPETKMQRTLAAYQGTGKRSNDFHDPETTLEDDLALMLQKYSTIGPGLVLVINQFTTERQGTVKDGEAIESYFKGKKFEIIEKKDLNKGEVNEEIQKVIKKLKTGKYEAFFCFYLSHGGEMGHLSTIPKPEGIQQKELTNPFRGNNLPQMRDKPKVFFIQACRGSKLQTDDSADSEKVEVEVDYPYNPPADADMLFAWSTVEDFQSLRDPSYGTWYIQILIEALKANKEGLHLLDILTVVNKRVAMKYGQLQGREARQMPCFMSTLQKHLHV